MIEVLQLPETTTDEFCRSLKERVIPHRITRRIPQSISEGIVTPTEVKRVLWWKIKNKQNPVVMVEAEIIIILPMAYVQI